MYIEFRTKKLRRVCECERQARREYGPENAKKLVQRLNEIMASENLFQLMQIPAARCHPLTGDRDGQWAVDLCHPYRLIFEPAGDQSKYLVGGHVDVRKVTRVRILRIEDYH
ncbi:MAG: type II toxin-antitoxin system RelE/ParE family toxin [Bacillota bacterium]|jgi:proteic killer suppression protein